MQQSSKIKESINSKSASIVIRFRHVSYLILVWLISNTFYLLEVQKEGEPLLFWIHTAILLLAVCVLFGGLFLFAKLTAMGSRGYVQREWEFIVEETPNILQFFSLLTLISIFMKEVNSRMVITVTLALILFVYLNVKRRKYFLAHTTELDRYHPLIIVLLQTCTIILVSIVTYGLASLITLISQHTNP